MGISSISFYSFIFKIACVFPDRPSQQDHEELSLLAGSCFYWLIKAMISSYLEL